jgi:hypothetical protein
MPRLNHSIRTISFIGGAAAFSVESAYADAGEGLEMPNLQFSPPMIAALMAYMDAVQPKWRARVDP